MGKNAAAAVRYHTGRLISVIVLACVACNSTPITPEEEAKLKANAPKVESTQLPAINQNNQIKEKTTYKFMSVGGATTHKENVVERTGDAIVVNGCSYPAVNKDGDTYECYRESLTGDVSSVKFNFQEDRVVITVGKATIVYSEKPSHIETPTTAGAVRK